MNTSLKREIHITVTFNLSVEIYITTCSVYTITNEVFWSHIVIRNKSESFDERRNTKGNILQNLIDK